MKTLYESILDDEDVLIGKSKECATWPYYACLLAYEKRYDELKSYLLQNKEFKEDIISLFSGKIIIESDMDGIKIYLDCDVFRPIIRFIPLRHNNLCRIDIRKIDSYSTPSLKYIKNKTKYSKIIYNLYKRYNYSKVRYADDIFQDYDNLYIDMNKS